MWPAIVGVGVPLLLAVVRYVRWAREDRRLAAQARALEHASQRTYGCGVAGTVVPLRRRDDAGEAR